MNFCMYHSDVSRPMKRSDEYCTTIVLKKRQTLVGERDARMAMEMGVMAMEMGVMAMTMEMEVMETIMGSMAINGLYPH